LLLLLLLLLLLFLLLSLSSSSSSWCLSVFQGDLSFQHLMHTMIPFGKPTLSTLGDAATAMQKGSLSDIDYTVKVREDGVSVD
jgi:hypothetical protein